MDGTKSVKPMFLDVIGGMLQKNNTCCYYATSLDTAVASSVSTSTVTVREIAKQEETDGH